MDENNEQNGTNSGANNESAGAPNSNQNKSTPNAGNNPAITFDDFLKQGDHQAEFDRRINKALETREKKLREQWKLEQDTQKTEAEKLASMNETQKLQYQIQKEKSEKEKAIAELNAHELKDQAIDIAKDKGLDISLLSYLDFKKINATDLNTKIDEMSKIFNEAVERAVNDRLKENTPTEHHNSINPSKAKEISRASF